MGIFLKALPSNNIYSVLEYFKKKIFIINIKKEVSSLKHTLLCRRLLPAWRHAFLSQ